MNELENLARCGIGVVVQPLYPYHSLHVSGIAEQSPASRDVLTSDETIEGLEPEDVITHFQEEGQDWEQAGIKNRTKVLLGFPGSTVRLRVRREIDGQTITFETDPITREYVTSFPDQTPAAYDVLECGMAESLTPPSIHIDSSALMPRSNQRA